MDKADMCELFRELMKRYNEYRTEWIKAFGTDMGFNAWFTKLVVCR